MCLSARKVFQQCMTLWYDLMMAALVHGSRTVEAGWEIYAITCYRSLNSACSTSHHLSMNVPRPRHLVLIALLSMKVGFRFIVRL
jgi:hypothetical protein